MMWLHKAGTASSKYLGVWARAAAVHGDPRARTLASFTHYTLVSQEHRSQVITVSFTPNDREKVPGYLSRIAELHTHRQRLDKQPCAGQELTRLDEKIAALKVEAEWPAAGVDTAVQQRAEAAGTRSDRTQSNDGELRELEHRVGASARPYAALLRRRTETRETNTPFGIRVAALASVPTRPSFHNPLLFVVPARPSPRQDAHPWEWFLTQTADKAADQRRREPRHDIGRVKKWSR